MKTAPLIMALLAPALLLAGGCSIVNLSGSAKDATSAGDETTSIVPSENWKEAAPGLSYRYFHTESSGDKALKDFFAVRIDPQRYAFEISQNRDEESAMTIKEIHEQTGSLLTFNGGFFTEDFKPTGLLVSGGEKIRNASSANLLDGIFAVDESGAPKLFDNDTPIDEKKYPFAIQNGPTLLDGEGNIMIDEDSGKTSSRTAIGLDADGNIILLILKPSLIDPGNHITLFEFARTLKNDPGFKELGLHSTLNLDGGGSTGLMIGDRYFPELDRVQNVVIVKARQ